MSNRIAVEVFGTDKKGKISSWKTEINGPIEKAKKYFALGKFFNIGTVKDKMVQIVKVVEITA